MTNSKNKEQATEAETTESAEVEASDSTEEVDAATDTVDQESSPADSSKKSGSSPLATTLAILALLGLIAIGGGGYHLMEQQQQQIEQQKKLLQEQITSTATQASSDQKDLQAKLEVVSLDLDANKGQFAAQKTALEKQKVIFEKQEQQFVEESKRVQARESELKTTLESVHRRIGRTGSQWMAAEAEYLIRVANHRLLLERDEKTALAALQAADGRLQATGDPLWTEVREALASEMSDVRALIQLDTIGKAAALGSLAKRVDKLRLIDSKAPEITVETKTTEPTDIIEVWNKAKKLLAQGWKGFQTLVIVRHHDAPITAMMPPEQRYFVYQNMRLQLEAARFAVLRADEGLYGSSLKTVSEWMNDVVELGDPVAKSMLNEINDLAKVNIRPELPDISGSLRLLREKMKVVAMGADAP
ncbi:hypothetical protein MNBD_GAMMA26-385 [hydrothermal vent metagenome]|uniref:Uroporphyrinogen-III C-methyltransferase n=1 Tax=hydrothermal vent metagenome TaxID=652676 RepID=A0A3B1B686_9ZZZZ